MTSILDQVMFADTLVYLDDVLSYAAMPDELAYAIDRMLTLVGERGIKPQPRKCELFARELVWCGHVLRDALGKKSAKGSFPTRSCFNQVPG